MALTCTNGGRECDGCGHCFPEPEDIGTCEACREAIKSGETHYNIEGDLLHEDCLLDWAWKYKVVGQ